MYFSLHLKQQVLNANLDSLNLNCKQNCLKSQKCNQKGIAGENALELQHPITANCIEALLNCKNNNNGNKTKSKLKLFYPALYRSAFAFFKKVVLNSTVLEAQIITTSSAESDMSESVSTTCSASLVNLPAFFDTSNIITPFSCLFLIFSCPFCLWWLHPGNVSPHFPLFSLFFLSFTALPAVLLFIYLFFFPAVLL